MTCEIASSARKRDTCSFDPMSFFAAWSEVTEFHTEWYISCPACFYVVGDLLSP